VGSARVVNNCTPVARIDTCTITNAPSTYRTCDTIVNFTHHAIPFR
jgi:hypothetical protein